MSRYHYERLKAESASHLMMENARSFTHSLSILVFEAGALATPGGGIDVDQISRGIEARLHLTPRFRQRLKWIPYENYPVWVDDAEFNLDYHVRHTALPHPGGSLELRKLVARLMSSRLHRSRPMWECWVVEGLKDDRFALISKVHNCMVESDSGADLFQTMLSGNRDADLDEPPPFSERPMPSGLELVRDEVFRRFSLPRQFARRVRAMASDSGGLRAEFGKRFDAAAKLFGYSVVPPRATPINGRLGPHRRFDDVVLPLDRVTAIHRAFDCTVHDALLAVLCRALRTFLQSQLVHPASLDLRVSTPVQVPADAGRQEVHEWIIELPVWQDDPKQMIEMIRERTRAAYESDPALGARSLFSVAQWSGSRLLTLAARSLSTYTPVNLSLVNLPGSQDPLYFLGAKLAEAYGSAPLRGEQGVSVSTISYDGKLCVGINADYDLVPDVAKLGSAMAHALDELSQLRRRRPRRLAAVKS
jgi:WS/DGAT/MGAT family acyltransferase